MSLKSKPPEWEKLTQHLEKWFHKPDLEALEAALSAAAAHPVIQGDPIWLFVQGPSGSGKTEIIVNALRLLPPYSRVLGTINKNSMISFNRGIPGGELLNLATGPNGEKTGIFIFKDFTTMLSLREEERTEVISQMREIYDGEWVRSTGSGAQTWKGKVTCVACCTPALETAWALKRDLGERFLTVKWGRRGSKELAKKAGKQRGHEKLIRDTTALLAHQFVLSSPMRTLPDIPAPIFDKIASLSEIVAVMRANVHRNPGGKREIVGAPIPEEPGRIHKSLSAIASSHAALFRHEEVEEDDYRIARRVGLDSIPSNRFAIFRHLPGSGDWITGAAWAKASGVVQSTLNWNAEELAALEAVELNEEKEVKEYRLSPKFLLLSQEAGLNFPL